MRIRHYGLLANRCRRKKLEQVRVLTAGTCNYSLSMVYGD